jgi:hypothetical protein
VTALILGWPLAVVLFWLSVPNDAFPVTYWGGRKAHLDIGGQRGAAIVSALDRQLGLTVTGVEPFGLEASAGSTPLGLLVCGRDGGPATLFGKLYALNHLRSSAGTSSRGRSSTGGLRTRSPSPRCGAWSSTRTICSA